MKKVSKTELWNYKIKPIHFARYENRIFKEVCLFIDHFFLRTAGQYSLAGDWIHLPETELRKMRDT